MKRMIVCCDGTWQDLKSSYPTNVVNISKLITPVAKDKISQTVFYDPGIGTESGLRKIFGGAFGWGIDNNIKEAYRFLCLNYQKKDEIYLFGFSRGAYTVRSLAGLIYNSGLVLRKNIRKIPQAYELYKDTNIHPENEVAKNFRKKYAIDVQITLLGCWDTVGSLGVPDQIPFLPIDRWINRKYRFHDTKLNNKIQHACHAVAIDERRKSFDYTPMQKSSSAENQILIQTWFAGDHASIGGGSKTEQFLSNLTLRWMIRKISELKLGLEFDQNKLEVDFKTNHTCPIDNRLKGIFKLTRPIWRELEDDKKSLDKSVKKRWRDVEAYRPQNLVDKFSAYLESWAEENRKAPS